jgi:hypothetical protein
MEIFSSFFIVQALLGNRYGPRTYKHLIDADEFDLLKKEVKKVSNKETVRKLEHCYEFDNNLQKYKLNVSKVEILKISIQKLKNLFL